MSKSNLALNRAVAEKIMGMKTRDLEEDFYVEVAKPDSYRWIQLPDYAGDANLCMAVVEEMRKTHRLKIEDYTDSDNGWYAAWDRKHPVGEAHKRGEHADRIGEASRETTMQRAVCLAALRARGHSREGL
jgi:hypothetical protein